MAILYASGSYKKKKPIQIRFSNKPHSKRNLLEPLNFDFRFYNSFSRFTYAKTSETDANNYLNNSFQ